MKAMLLLGAAAPVALTLASTSARSIPPAPPIADGKRQLIRWMPGEVRCGGEKIMAVRMQQPFDSMGFARPAVAQAYRFRIDEEGRPLSIVNDRGARFSALTDDVEAALTASRFTAGAARTECRVEYRSQATPLEEAPAVDLMAYSLSPISGPMPAAAWKRLVSDGSTCLAAPRPAPLNRAFPDFNALPATPGTRDWTMVGYDLDAKGRPVRPHVVAGTDNAALDKASVKAVRASRFTGGARTGCLYPYWRTPATMAAPAIPETDMGRPKEAKCDVDRDWAVQPRLAYPAAYRRRAIEGWAVIAYDVAPWGETGNVRVLASEPSAAFGEQAVQMIRAARKASSASGASGCIEKVRFVIGAEDRTEEASQPLFLD
ncbi:TonB family protein [Sphingobium sp.]|uniref:TonB family protein n=1 Tax=Sphingobium sp. TaxID=1912891 RepID=UPI002D0915DA|nr:TonB family protein [Sphingobium sp.]HUD95771.1 TonB family protein [Sphingobium sp.]